MTDESTNTLDRITAVLEWISMSALLAPLAAHSYLGIYSRFHADDYCTTGSLKELGLFGSQVYWYTSWSGRFAFTFVINLLESLGPWVTRVMPAMVILLFLVVYSILFQRAARLLGVTLHPRYLGVLASVVIFATLSGVGAPFQSIYWLTGITTYSLPLILLGGYLIWLLNRIGRGERAPSNGFIYFGSFLAMFAAGGFSETYVSVQTALLILLLIGSASLARKDSRRKLVKFVFAGLIGSLLALLLIAAAPGNAVRAGIQPVRADFFELLGRTYLDFKIFVSRVLHDELLVLLLSGLVPALVGMKATWKRRNSGRLTVRSHIALMFGLPLLAAVLIAATILPYEYGISSYPDERVLMTARLALFAIVALWSLALGEFIGASWPFGEVSLSAIAAVGMILVVILAGLAAYAELTSALEERSRLIDFAQTWDARNAQLSLAATRGERRVEARSLTHMGGLAEIGYDPNEWINLCVAQAYDLDHVVAK